ncbi:MAG TPA: FAD-binding oxidoreductase [Candidatus Bathyarchaeia archaeon]|nr:FAD-binding oxidoreductase [Candidatus Bathyarchaeia archaeon]
MGSQFVRTEPEALEVYSVDRVLPAVAVQPENAEQAAEAVRIAIQGKLSLITCGARTSLGIGMPPSTYDVALDMTRLGGIAHYDAGDLTVSVNAGTRLAELAKVLLEKNQFLPLAVPFCENATVGGAIAAGLDSPLRHFYGTARDFMIGAEFVDGTGASAKSGGRVVKNVTGYDFHKLLHGSLGTLAVITRVNFRTFPLQPSRRGFLASFADETGALGFAKQVADSALTPTMLEVLSPEFAELFLEEKSPVASLRLDVEAWTVCVGFEGSAEVCERYRRDLSRLARTASARDAIAVHDSQFLSLLEILREAPAAMSRLTTQSAVLRFVTLPGKLSDLVRALRSFANSSWMSSVILIRSASIVYLGLMPRNGDESALKQAAYFWKSVASLRGQMEFNASILFCPAEWKAELNVWAYAGSAVELGQRVKKAFDPSGTFACGRYVGGV